MQNTNGSAGSRSTSRLNRCTPMGRHREPASGSSLPRPDHQHWTVEEPDLSRITTSRRQGQACEGLDPASSQSRFNRLPIRRNYKPQARHVGFRSVLPLAPPCTHSPCEWPRTSSYSALGPTGSILGIGGVPFPPSHRVAPGWAHACSCRGTQLRRAGTARSRRRSAGVLP